MTPDEIAALLAEARAARHALLTGKAKAVVRFGDRSVEYSRSSLADLDAYIAELVGGLTDPSNVIKRPRLFRVTQTGNGYGC